MTSYVIYLSQHVRAIHIIFDRKLHKLIFKANKMTLASKRNVYCWEEITCNFISFLFLKKRIKPELNYPVKFSIRCKLFPLCSSLLMACKERHNLSMNRASLDHLSWDRTTPLKCTAFYRNIFQNFLYIKCKAFVTFYLDYSTNWEYGSYQVDQRIGGKNCYL